MIKMNKMLIIPILAFLVITMPIAFADEDEDEYEEEEDYIEGFGVMEREREREHQDDDEDGLAIGSGAGNMILYFTIGAIVASVAYTGFKIFKSKRQVIARRT